MTLVEGDLQLPQAIGVQQAEGERDHLAVERDARHAQLAARMEGLGHPAVERSRGRGGGDRGSLAALPARGLDGQPGLDRRRKVVRRLYEAHLGVVVAAQLAGETLDRGAPPRPGQLAPGRERPDRVDDRGRRVRRVERAPAAMRVSDERMVASQHRQHEHAPLACSAAAMTASRPAASRAIGRKLGVSELAIALRPPAVRIRGRPPTSRSPRQARHTLGVASAANARRQGESHASVMNGSSARASSSHVSARSARRCSSLTHSIRSLIAAAPSTDGRARRADPRPARSGRRGAGRVPTRAHARSCSARACRARPRRGGRRRRGHGSRQACMHCTCVT